MVTAMLTTRLTPEELKAVTERAEREGVARSELVREALRHYLELCIVSDAARDAAAAAL